MAGRETYDIDPLQREILEFRQARRQKLREKYLEEFHNPYRHANGPGGPIDDVAVNRYQAMRATTLKFFKPTVKNFLYVFLVAVVPYGLAIWSTTYIRTKRENEIRTGKVSYRNREYKLH